MTRMNCCLFAYAILHCAMVAAWEIEPGVPLPPLSGYLPDTVELTQVKVNFDPNLVRIEYRLRNQANHPSNFALASYLPPFGWQGAAADYPDMHFPELNLSQDKHHLPASVQTIAWADGMNVSGMLARYKIDPLLVAQADAAFDRSRLGAGILAGPHLYHAEGDVLVPDWQVQVTRHWKLTLAAHTDADLEVSYRPRPSKQSLSPVGKEFKSLVYAHCGEPDAILTTLKQQLGGLPEYVHTRTYRIPVAMANIGSLDYDVTAHVATAPDDGITPAAILICPGDGTTLPPGVLVADGIRIVDRAVLSVLMIYH
jgi:hypothetical protein